ncbi:MAG: DUF4919 domain-containing protein [Rikenellaceae bacterium]|nr:DUF4919 domain-containing protein [Rikenellaceae bacterium]
MKRLLLALLVAMPFGGMAQIRIPDDDAIERLTGDTASRFFYPRMMSRYLHCDSTLTLEDYHYLYYGYIFQPDYDPWTSPAEADSVLSVFWRNENPTPLECRQLVEYVHRIMLREPFSPRHINLLIYAYGIMGDHEMEIKNFRRLEYLMETIMTSGTGLKEDSPWQVLYFNHIEDLILYLDLKQGKHVLVSRSVEYVPLLERRNGIKGYYFDFGRLYTRLPDRPEKQKRGATFNGIRIR